MRVFVKSELKKLFVPQETAKNGQVTIIGGSKLFHGAPLLSLKVASRISDMVFFASPDPSLGKVAEKVKSKLFSFIWVPWDEVEEYVRKSDAVLIGPGFMRFRSEKVPESKRYSEYDKAAKDSRKTTQKLLEKFPKKRWVIDAGSLQVIDPELLPRGCVITPNEKEFEYLFGRLEPGEAAKKYNCVVNAKGLRNIVCSPKKCVEIPGGNPGLSKGGVGDVLAGLAVALLAKNDPFLAAASASYIAKTAADELYKKVGTNYNADDLADKIPEALHKLAL